MPEPEAVDVAVETVVEEPKPDDKLTKALQSERERARALEKKVKEFEKQAAAAMELPERLKTIEAERDGVLRQLKVRDFVDASVGKLGDKYSVDRGKVMKYAEKLARVAETDVELEDEISAIIGDLRVPVTVKTAPLPAARSDAQPDPLAGKQPGDLTHAELIAISKQDMSLYNTIMNTRRSALSKTK